MLDHVQRQEDTPADAWLRNGLNLPNEPASSSAPPQPSTIEPVQKGGGGSLQSDVV